MQSEAMLLYGILGSPGCEDMVVDVCKPGPHCGKRGRIWCYNRPVCPGVSSRSPYHSIGGKGKYVVEVDLKEVRYPRTRSYCLHTYSQLNSVNVATSGRIPCLDLAKRMRLNNEVSHTPWLNQYNNRELEDVENTLKQIMGIRVSKKKKTKAKTITKSDSSDSDKVGSSDDDDDDDDGLAEMRQRVLELVPDNGDGSDVSGSDDDEEERDARDKRRDVRRRAIRRTRAKKMEELKALSIEQDEEEAGLGVGEREWLIFCRTSELRRPPVLLELLASDFQVFEEDVEHVATEIDDSGNISQLRRRLGLTSKKKYALMRWKGLPPVQRHDERVYAGRANVVVVDPSAPHPHPSCPVLRCSVCEPDPVQRMNAVYMLKRVCHTLRIKIHIEECETIEALVSCLVQGKAHDANLVFCALDRLPGIGGDLLKRSLDASSVGVPTVLVSSLETLPRAAAHPGVHDFRGLTHAISEDSLRSFPGKQGPGAEGLKESPTALMYLPWTRAKIRRAVVHFWLPLEQQRMQTERRQLQQRAFLARQAQLQLAPRPRREHGSAIHTWNKKKNKKKKSKSRGKPPGPIEFLGKDAASTLALNHKSGLDRMGMSRWYASNSSDLVRNIPSIEKRWLQEADASLKQGAKPLNLDGDDGVDGEANVLRGLRISIQKKQISRRMRENLMAQSKIVLDLLPRR